jgi:hypothetical protein
MPYFKLANIFEAKIEEFRYKQLVSKSFYCIKTNPNIKLNKKLSWIIKCLQDRKKLLIFAAMIDQAHETKLKMLNFVDKMQPVLYKSKALCLSKWITYHSDQMKNELSQQHYL